MTEDRDKWRKFVHGVACPRIEDVSKNGTEYNRSTFKCVKHGRIELGFGTGASFHLSHIVL